MRETDGGRGSISKKVAALGDLSRGELVELWQKHYRCPPPSGVRQPLLVRAAAWHVQERQLGGLSNNAKRLLKAAMKRVQRNELSVDGPAVENAKRVTADQDGVGDAPVEKQSSRAECVRPLPLPGARLIRDWNGRRYVVDVIDGGFVLDGKQYRSLTAIAFRITGAKWSGPRFFGL